jgi:hypothetical protein
MSVVSASHISLATLQYLLERSFSFKIVSAQVQKCVKSSCDGVLRKEIDNCPGKILNQFSVFIN